MADALKRNPVAFRAEYAQGWENSAFFDAYFSNYIEGTKFEVDQAAAVIFEGRIMQDRPKDSHDILGAYHVTNNRAAMQTVPENFEEFLQLIKSRHLTLFARRPEISAGDFKTEVNSAGDTIFVSPDLVRGTLLRGFDLYKSLEPGFERAAYMMFLTGTGKREKRRPEEGRAWFTSSIVSAAWPGVCCSVLCSWCGVRRLRQQFCC